MSYRNRAVLAAAAFVALLVGCKDQSSPAEPPQRAEVQDRSSFAAGGSIKTLDQLMDSLNSAVPGFSGFHLEGARLVASATATADTAKLSLHLRNFLERYSPRIASAEIEARLVSYEFSDLAEWRTALARGAPSARFVFLDVDERANMVVIAVEDPSSAVLIEQTARNLGIPSDALSVVESPPIRPLQSSVLQVHQRPVRGGLLIGWQTSVEGGECTAGYNVKRQADSNRYLLVNSHCSEVTFGPGNAEYCQPAMCGWGPYVIGTEYLDPTPFSCDYGSCRYSDSALLVYNDSTTWDYGYLAHDEDRDGTYIADPNPSYPSLPVSNYYPIPVLGMELDKIGQATGWTVGEVTRTCANATQAGVTLLCQHDVAAGSDNGDSGSPVFAYDPSHAADPVGILWGKSGLNTYVFSSWNGIWLDLGGDLTPSP